MVAAMKWLFTLLLLGNIALAVVMQLPQEKSGADSTAGHAPYFAEKIRLMAEEDIPPLPPATTQVCLEWGLFASQEIAQVKTALKTLRLDEKDLTQLDAPGKASTYWVYIPPLKSRQDAQKKVDELKSLGVEDSFVMQDNNKWRHAISLGVFSTADAADKYLLSLREKGVKSAKAGPRNPEGGHASLVIRSGGANIEAELVKLKQEFPGTELKAVPCSE
jgi:hypothetical protein